MPRYTGHQLPGGPSTSGSSPAASFLSSVSSTLVSRHKQRTEKPKPYVFHGTATGQKEFIARAAGKQFAPEKVYKDLRRMNEAIKHGQHEFINSRGDVVSIGKVTPAQRYIAAHWANQGKVESREGVQRLTKGIIETVRKEEVELKLRQGLKMGTATEAARRFEKIIDVKPGQSELQNRMDALANLHARTGPTPGPQAQAQAKTQTAGPRPSTFAFMDPGPVGGGRPSMSSTTSSRAFQAAPSGGGSIVADASTASIGHAVIQAEPAMETYSAVIILKDFSFEPGNLKIQGGQIIRLKLMNQGSAAHSFKVPTLDYHSGPIPPGGIKVAIFHVPAQAGSYEFRCGLADHPDRPMIGAMIVHVAAGMSAWPNNSSEKTTGSQNDTTPIHPESSGQQSVPSAPTGTESVLPASQPPEPPPLTGALG